MITIKPNDGTYLHGFRISGHAGFADVGKDIVCAGVSALAQTTAETLRRYTHIIESTKKGEMIVNIPTEKSWYSAVIMHTFCVGIELLAENYPEHINYEEGKPAPEKESTWGIQG